MLAPCFHDLSKHNLKQVPEGAYRNLNSAFSEVIKTGIDRSLENMIITKVYGVEVWHIIQCTSIVKKLAEIPEVEIILSVLKCVYLGQIVSDLNKLAKSKTECFQLKSKENFGKLTKSICSFISQTFYLV